jgi:hypothetical protein
MSRADAYGSLRKGATMRIAERCREEKERHPERFCPERRCLWRVVTRAGINPCLYHPVVPVPPVVPIPPVI